MPSLSELLAAHKKASEAKAIEKGLLVPNSGKEEANVETSTSQTPVAPNNPSVGKQSFTLVPKAATVSPPSNLPPVASKDTVAAPLSSVVSPQTAQLPEFDVANVLQTGLEKISQEDLTGFRETLEIIRKAYAGEVADMDFIINAMKRILVDLRAHSEFVKILLPQDVGMLVRVLRESYGIAVNTKKENKRKRAVSSADKKEFEDMLAGFGDLKI